MDQRVYMLNQTSTQSESITYNKMENNDEYNVMSDREFFGGNQT